jgi:hypothetical protein
MPQFFGGFLLPPTNAGDHETSIFFGSSRYAQLTFTAFGARQHAHRGSSRK